jgi:putative peptide zinc metalloprotease protein
MTNVAQLKESAFPGRLREDLQVSQQESAKGPRFVVRDPKTTKIYMFSETSFKLLQRLSPEKSLEQTIQEMTGTGKPSPRAIAAMTDLITKAQAAGLLNGSSASAAQPGLKPSARRFNPFFITIPLLNVESILNIIGPIFRPAFAPVGFAIWIASMLCALTMVSLRWPLVYATARNASGIYALTGGYGLFLALTVVHEFGHAIACFRYGINVREMGVLMYFFQPCAYCNISNAWMESSLKKRLVVSLGGIYFESFLWSLVAILWVFSPLSASWHRLLFMAGAVLLVRTIINLFPFFTLDGYYILSDLLQIPNLRPKSFVYLLSKVPLLGRFFRVSVELSPWEKIVLLSYGVISASCMALALGVSAYAARKSLLKIQPHNGNAIFWGLLAVTLLASLPGIYGNLRSFTVRVGAEGRR